MKEIEYKIYDIIDALVEGKKNSIGSDSPLIGDGSMLDSMKLVELCIALEDLSNDFDFLFDWTSDVAMSKSRSMFRSAGDLVKEFLVQMEASKQ